MSIFGIMTHKTEKQSKNYLPLGTTGFGLWEIWWDEGPGTPARPVTHGVTTKKFLLSREAASEARHLADLNTNRRYCIKMSYWYN